MEKQITINGQQVPVTLTSSLDASGILRVTVTATHGDTTYAESWLPAHDNPEYTPEQFQIDADAHCAKVARAMLGRELVKTLFAGLK